MLNDTELGEISHLIRYSFSAQQLDQALQLLLDYLTCLLYTKDEEQRKTLKEKFFNKITAIFHLKLKEEVSLENCALATEQILENIQNDKISYMEQQVFYIRILYGLLLRDARNPLSLLHIQRTFFDPRANVANFFNKNSTATVDVKSCLVFSRLITYFRESADFEKIFASMLSFILFLVIGGLGLEVNSDNQLTTRAYYCFVACVLLFCYLITQILSIHFPIDNIYFKRTPKVLGPSLSIADLAAPTKKALADLANITQFSSPEQLLPEKFISWYGTPLGEVRYDLNSLSVHIIPLKMFFSFGKTYFIYWNWHDLIAKNIINSDLNSKNFTLYTLGICSNVRHLKVYKGYYWQNNILHLKLSSYARPITFSQYYDTLCGKYRLYFPDQRLSI